MHHGQEPGAVQSQERLTVGADFMHGTFLAIGLKESLPFAINIVYMRRPFPRLPTLLLLALASAPWPAPAAPPAKLPPARAPGAKEPSPDAKGPAEKRPSAKDASASDPLLRKPWMQEDLERTRGTIHRLSQLLERSGSQFPIRDNAGREFRMDLRGRVTLEPDDGNWRTVVPRRSESALVLAEAEALYGRGLREHAVFLLKAVADMSRLPEADGAVRADAARAAQRLNELSRREDFADWDTQSDPFVLYDDLRDETVVSSHHHRFRLVLPGPWRYQFGAPRRDRTQWPERVLYLGQGALVLTVGLDDFGRVGAVRRLAGLVDLWDLRRSLSPQRRDQLDHKRTRDSEVDAFCQPSAIGRFAATRRSGMPVLDAARLSRPERAEPPACGLFATELTGVTRGATDAAEAMERFRTGNLPEGPRRKRMRFLEFFHLRPSRGLFLEFRLPEGAEVPARETFLRGLQGLRLY